MTLGRLKVVMIGVVLLTAGCEAIGNPFESIGQKPPAPDEFAVIERKPLRLPPSLSLPKPRLGERSAVEPDPNADAVAALLGAGAAASVSGGGAVPPPAQPEPVITPVVLAPGPGEQSLLAAAGAAGNNSDVRAQLDAENTEIDETQPYEPPSVFDLLSEGEAPPADALDADAEARRLQAEGIVTPINPWAQVPDDS